MDLWRLYYSILERSRYISYIQKQSIDEIKEDSDAFIFTLKNPHGVEPTRYKNRKDEYAIYCDPQRGPTFGRDDLYLTNHGRQYVCFIQNDGARGYECHPQYKASFFVNTNKPDETNRCIVLDYEVFTCTNYEQSTVVY